MHPSDDALIGIVDDDSIRHTSLLAAHLDTCTQCTLRIEKLRETRGLLQEAAGDAVEPKHDLAARTMNRLRVRRSSIGNLNEVVAAMRALLRGFVDLFGGGSPADPSAAISQVEKGAPRG